MCPKSGAEIRFPVSKFETDAKIRDRTFELPPIWIWIRQQFKPSDSLKFCHLFEALKREKDFRLPTLETSFFSFSPVGSQRQMDFRR